MGSGAGKTIGLGGERSVQGAAGVFMEQGRDQRSTAPEWQRQSEQLLCQGRGTAFLAAELQVADRELCPRARRPWPKRAFASRSDSRK